MRALVFDGKVRQADVPMPKRGCGEALIRVDLAGICNTDVEITKGYLSYEGILGHEFVGVVEEADSPGLMGKRVVGEINIACNECEMCRRGHGRHCEHVRVMGIRDWPGCMADYVVLPECNLHVVPDEAGDRQAVFTEPLAAGLEICEQVHIRPSDTVVVIGDGKLGLITAQAISASGHPVIVLGRHEEKLSIARRLGMETHMTADFNGVADVVIDCTGNPSGIEAAMGIVRPLGTIVLKSTFHKGEPLNLTPVVRNEVTVVGSRCGLFPPALELLARGAIDTEPMVEAVFPADRMEEAFDRACQRGSLKVIVDYGA